MTPEQEALIAAVFKHGGLKRLERFIIDSMLEYCQGSPARAATALGVCRKTIYNWKTEMKKLD